MKSAASFDMGNQKVDPNEWWSGLSGSERAFFHEIIRHAEELLEHEMLRVRFNGVSYSPVLITQRDPAIQPGRSGRLRPVHREPEQWWVGLSLKERTFVWGLSRIIKDLPEHGDEYLEIENIGNGLRASQVANFKNPTGGRAEVN